MHARLAILCLAVLAGCGGGGTPAAERAGRAELDPRERTVGPPPQGRPNVVFVLTDDLSTDLLRFMPNVRRLQRDGTTFSRYIVASSNCCPSRASMLTGQLPHNTGVLTNVKPNGGNFRFKQDGNQRRTFAVDLRRAGYRTALMGKYLNGYAADRGVRAVPPGWTDWAGSDNGYNGYRFTLNETGRTRYYGYSTYVTDVLARRARSFVADADAEGRPFFLTLSTFAPHAPAIPARQDAERFPDLTAPRSPAYDARNVDPPSWLRGREPLREQRKDGIDFAYQQRARSVQAVDRTLGQLRRDLQRRGLADDTYVVFSSDNGYHMGEHRLYPGKFTAFDTDVRVPLIVAGPDVPAGATVDALASNIDLAPTFLRLAGRRPPARMDGRSLLGLLRGDDVPGDWRAAAVLEHTKGVSNRKQQDPDAQGKLSGNPPDYDGLRLADETYVEYADGDREYYDLTTDPHQLTNTYGELDADRRRELSALLDRLRRCAGAAECSTETGGGPGVRTTPSGAVERPPEDLGR